MGMIPSLSVDNADDVGPRSTSRILSLSDAYNLLEAVDGVYVAGGLLAEGVESPVLSVRAEITADPVTFASVNLFVDGNLKPKKANRKKKQRKATKKKTGN